ncbi:homocysteine S-methyltransferase [Modestobacter sp. VKM Ac-2979]|uniref:homocysteine S-methyltransferase n=1 Tax=unclassified Modestobacter TaxID=2643866 RepID=UPI0022AB8308|nr:MULTISPECIES: homocysteine S-methyltransferase [unclassified Modestobacter]MCZ2812754.1 homocysteine S-methyltransferase [Modestobacter sp. VKM Ac-2979]MCZ2843217.1 homocysteine S-methyltransferase [Modestobacter sp. VKM Ac-2980]
MSTLAEALRTGTVVADGGLSTELESRGHDVTSSLWSARLLRDDPAAVTAAHAAFARAGAQVATTASYQASFPGFTAAGIDGSQARALMTRSVRLARDGLAQAGRDGWVAASIGPYGAFLADGSEYTGDYVEHVSVAELRAFHRPRLAVLAEAGADVLACETLPAAAEVEALLTELDELGVPAWLSLTSATGPDGVPRTRRGERLDEICAMARDVDAVIAVGVNCTDPAGVPAAVAAAAASGKPGVAYPNSGEVWDATARRWTGRPGVGDVSGWLAAGARLVGGCCRVRPDDVRALADAVPLPHD